LRKQIQDLKSASPATAPAADTAPPSLATVARMMMGAFRGNNPQQRMLLLKTRLKLSPDQEAQIKAAMDADNQKRREIGRQMFSGGKVDPALAASANSLDQTLAAILTPDQQAAYKQVQADEQAARANTAVTMQVNQMAPLLQLSDAQKDQVFNTLYQIQTSAPDPGSLMTNPNAASVLTSQAQAVQAAMSKALTPDQLALYQQQAALQQQGGPGGPGGPGRRGNGGNGGGTATGATTATSYAPATVATTSVVTTTTPAPATPSDSTTTATTTTTTDSSTNSASATASTNAATTNAAPAQ
jgi:hypothetical protein